jgi:hypothetical protein
MSTAVQRCDGYYVSVAYEWYHAEATHPCAERLSSLGHAAKQFQLSKIGQAQLAAHANK